MYISRAGASTTRVLILPKMINMNILKTLYSSTTRVLIFQYSYSYVEYSPQPCILVIFEISLNSKAFSWWWRNGVSIPRGRRFHSRNYVIWKIFIGIHFHILMQHKQSGTKPNLVAKILATKIGNLWASVAYRYRKSISIIELFVSIISIYIGFLATNF